jgi:hypothetical protein
MKFSSNRVTVADTFSKKIKFRDIRPKKMIRTALRRSEYASCARYLDVKSKCQDDQLLVGITNTE